MVSLKPLAVRISLITSVLDLVLFPATRPSPLLLLAVSNSLHLLFLVLSFFTLTYIHWSSPSRLPPSRLAPPPSCWLHPSPVTPSYTWSSALSLQVVHALFLCLAVQAVGAAQFPKSVGSSSAYRVRYSNASSCAEPYYIRAFPSGHCFGRSSTSSMKLDCSVATSMGVSEWNTSTTCSGNTSMLSTASVAVQESCRAPNPNDMKDDATVYTKVTCALPSVSQDTALVGQAWQVSAWEVGGHQEARSALSL
jgi:hypothetical protein